MKKNLASFVIVFIFILFFSYYHNNNGRGYYGNIKFVQLAGQNIKVELALTPEAQAKGLSARTALAENEGMLFVFDRSGEHPFWMKDMNFAIDIIWISEDGKIVYIKKDARPENFLETYGPEEDALYVLEVVSGFSEKNNLKVGDEVQFID